MIHTTRSWHVRRNREGSVVERKLKDGESRYITNATSLDEHQLEHAKRLSYSGHYANYTIGNSIGATVFSSGALASFLCTDAAFPLMGNIVLDICGGIATLITATFAGCGVSYGRKARRESKAKNAKVSSDVRLFPVAGLQWDMLKQALEEIEKDDIAKAKVAAKAKSAKPVQLKQRRSAGRFSKMVKEVRQQLEDKFAPEEIPVTQPDSEVYTRPVGAEPVIWHIFMTALKDHTDLGRMCDTYVSNYLLHTEDLVVQKQRTDQTNEWKNKLNETLKRAAYAQMEIIYPDLANARDMEGFQPAELVTEDEYRTLRTRSEAAVAAEMAICAAEPLTYSYQKQLH